ncbi:MAG: FliA/WhiG family RNA polymerase sigma factor [Hungatella sp.]|jgi:RNA polymerase sigma factor for flagellar operon FliA|nr:FliA/WhiG family RNA polymerase sigma factor [Hungatella sp.]MCI9502837.1 FliA/WhiG family RNA polymerase sigma factor [Hungatella sp.]MCI9638356.1 FliA/WhiG family RNA polymerase sigma factor [Hungatella sp.]
MVQTDYLEEKTNEELLEMYRAEGRIEIKQALVLRYLYIVKTIANQMRNVYTGSLQMEDIINEGVIAIMKGLDRYDPERDNKFETFISRRIRGMIIDLVRKNDWMPRDFRKQVKAMEEQQAVLGRKLGRLPSDEEVASAMGMDIRKYRKLQRMSVMMNVLSLDMITDDEGEHQSLQLSSGDVESQPERAFLKVESRQVLAEAINSLKEKEKMVVSLYYVEELNMGQIAQILGVSEPRISQIHSSAIRKLKAYMSQYN